ncbi:MAG: hypothetical protein IPM84_13010 [Anaerolineae bacterium]|nr:hypothetical protein [Anaerolineae bacterium]
MPDQESRLQSSDGRVVLTIPAGTVSAPTLVRYTRTRAIPISRRTLISCSS